MPDQPASISRLEETEALLPKWERNCHVQAALGRAAALEQLQQWRVALTILEEALQSYSASEGLTGAARRVRDRLADHERQKKLARRLDLIGQKIAAQSWRQALTLLENTQREFPEAPELVRHSFRVGRHSGGIRGCNSQDQRTATGCTLNRSQESKMEMPGDMKVVEIAGSFLVGTS